MITGMFVQHCISASHVTKILSIITWEHSANILSKLTIKDHVSTGKKQDMLREQTITRPSKQPDEIESENLDHSVSTRRSIEAPDSSKSFLLRQLR